MTKVYGFKFGPQKASQYTGLSPSFTIFNINGISALTGPGISETPAASGIYQFQFGATLPIIFEIDGGASITTATDRYVYGTIDPADRSDEYGNTILAGLTNIGSTLIGSTASSFGTDSVDPSTLMGFSKRIVEFLEGNATFTKSSGSWAISSRGSSQLLRTKTLTNDTSSTTKT